MTDKKQENLKAVSVAMPQSMRDKLEEKAKKEGRTFSNYVRMILSKHA